MVSKIDAAILKALSLDAASTTIASHGGSGFASTYKITSARQDGKDKFYFVKTGSGKNSEVMFAGEHQSLNTIHNTLPSLCPKSYSHGPLSTGGFYLITDFLNLSPRSTSHSSPQSHLSLATKVAKLHSVPAPIPKGYSSPQFGFPVPTCCGDTVQDNSWKDNWADFYADNRLRHVLACAEKNNGKDPNLRSLLEITASHIVPRLLRDGHLKAAGGGNVKPVVVHGDLWSGNHGRGCIGDGETEEVVFDPSSAYAHSEYEFGIMRMLGGFGKGFEKEYYDVKGGRDEPVEEWEDRVLLYELYHHLNHYSIFGGGYKGGAESVMKKLIKKFGDGK